MTWPIWCVLFQYCQRLITFYQPDIQRAKRILLAQAFEWKLLCLLDSCRCIFECFILVYWWHVLFYTLRFSDMFSKMKHCVFSLPKRKCTFIYIDLLSCRQLKVTLIYICYGMKHLLYIFLYNCVVTVDDLFSLKYQINVYQRDTVWPHNVFYLCRPRGK